MHLPDSMINNALCPLTLVASVASIIMCRTIGYQQKFILREEGRDADEIQTPQLWMRVCAVAALVFALQMINIPVGPGVSGHPVGGVLAMLILGVPYGMLAMVLVLCVQCFVYNDGGVLALSVNTFTMGGVSAVCVYGMHVVQAKKGVLFSRKKYMIAVVSWIAVIIGSVSALACIRVEAVHQFLAPMIAVHSIIGIVEAIVTVCVYTCVECLAKRCPSFSLNTTLFFFAFFFAAFLSPFASSFPDGLEWTFRHVVFEAAENCAFPAFFSDYRVSGISNGIVSTSIAASLGIVFFWVSGYTLQTIKGVYCWAASRKF